MIETVGWNLGDKKAAPCYLRDIEDGSFIIGDDGVRILAADFTTSLLNIRNSLEVQDFPWLAQDHDGITTEPQGWAMTTAASGILLQNTPMSENSEQSHKKELS